MTSGWTGPTAINGSDVFLESSNTLSLVSPVTVAAGATLGLDDFSQTLTSLAGAGRVLLGNGGTLTVGGNNVPTTFSGVISGRGTLIKVSTRLNDGYVCTGECAGGLLDVQGGTLDGSGYVLGNLRNAGRVRVGGAAAAGYLYAYLS